MIAYLGMCTLILNSTSSKVYPNNDTFISINDELKPRLIDQINRESVVTPGQKCTPDNLPCSTWVASHYSLIPTLDIIDKVSSDISILIQQGKNDLDTPV
jgi:uncharacterized protein